MLVRAALKEGKQCFIPYLADAKMYMVALASEADLASLPSNKWGIREPPAEPRRERGTSASFLLFLLTLSSV